MRANASHGIGDPGWWRPPTLKRAMKVARSGNFINPLPCIGVRFGVLNQTFGSAPGDIAGELARRRLGYGRGPRMRFEGDELTLIGGIRHGRTLGSPVAIEIGNSEWNKDPDKWQKEMSPSAVSTSSTL